MGSRDKGVTRKLNCWEFKKCGREPGGVNVNTLGPCPAATEARADGIHGGKNGGRVCWVIAGTLCEGQVQGTFAVKLASCFRCDFFRLVLQEEKEAYVYSKNVLNLIRNEKASAKEASRRSCEARELRKQREHH